MSRLTDGQDGDDAAAGDGRDVAYRSVGRIDGSDDDDVVGVFPDPADVDALRRLEVGLPFVGPPRRRLNVEPVHRAQPPGALPGVTHARDRAGA